MRILLGDMPEKGCPLVPLSPMRTMRAFNSRLFLCIFIVILEYS